MADKIDNLVERLNEVEGIAFVRDAWNEKAPETYGVVEMDGADRTIWIDDQLIEQSFKVTVTIYVADGTDKWIRKIQSILNDMGLSYSLPQRAYDYDMDKVMWQWTVFIYGPIVEDED